MALQDFIRRLRPGRNRGAPQRETLPFSTVLGSAASNVNQPLVRSTPRALRSFSRSPVARRAINAIKLPISMLKWDVVPKNGIKPNSELMRQCELVKNCLSRPNSDDSFRTLVEQVINDYLIGAGAIEIGRSSDPNRPVWLWPVDGLSIEIYPRWSGKANEIRYLQRTYTVGGMTETGIKLRNDELIYIRPNPDASTPYGTAPLEVAFRDISSSLATGKFAGKVASNGLPPFLLDMGTGIDGETLASFRRYWRNDVEGQGNIPIVGLDFGGGSVNVSKLYPQSDEGLFLKYQEFLRREIAIAFDLSPMTLGLERDVNRSTGQTMMERDWQDAIAPAARLFGAHITREVIEATLNFSQIEFQWLNLEMEDEDLSSTITTRLFNGNVITQKEARDRHGLPPANTQWDNCFRVDMEIAQQAARSAGVIDDESLPTNYETVKDDGTQTPQPIPEPERPNGYGRRN